MFDPKGDIDLLRRVYAEAKLFKPGDEVYYAGSIARQGANSEFSAGR